MSVPQRPHSLLVPSRLNWSIKSDWLILMIGMTAAEQLDTLERLEVFLARHPGRAMELHQKLSSPSRKRSIPDTVKRFQVRQAKASAKREALQLEKAQKLRELLRKVCKNSFRCRHWAMLPSHKRILYDV